MSEPQRPEIPYGHRLKLPAAMAVDIIALAILKRISRGECYARSDLLQLGFTGGIIDALYQDACEVALLERSSLELRSENQRPKKHHHKFHNLRTSRHPQHALNSPAVGGRKGPGPVLPVAHRNCGGL